MIITWLGGLSALFGAAAGLLENDLKRIIAYSTTSQLGYMVVAIGLSQHSLALFHLVNHAFFKALLFLSAGAVIHAMSDQQDIRRMGGLVLFLPVTYSMMLLGSLSLMAFPFLTGFWSKDFLLELALIPRNATSTIAYILTLVAAILTATYSARLLIQTFISEPNGSTSYLRAAHTSILDPSVLMLIPLLVLWTGATFFGYIAHELFIGLGSEFYQQALFTHPNHLALLDGSLSQAGAAGGNYGAMSWLKYLPMGTLVLLFTLIPVVTAGEGPLGPNRGRPLAAARLPGPRDSQPAAAAGLSADLGRNVDGPGRNPALTPGGSLIGALRARALLLGGRHPTALPLTILTSILNHFNIYNHWIMHKTLSSAVILNRYFDRGLLEVLGPTGLVRLFHFLAFRLELLSTGFIPHYAFLIITFLPLILFAHFTSYLFLFIVFFIALALSTVVG